MMTDMRAKIALLGLIATLGCGGNGQQVEVRKDTTRTDTVRHEDHRRIVLFLGTSLTAGYGVGVEHAFPTIVQQKIDSAGLPFRVVNAGLSGETSAGGLRRLDWSLQQPVDVFVLELGANDGLRGLPVENMKANLDTILQKTSAKYPQAALVIAGMQAPPNLGAAYTSAFQEAFRSLAKQYHATLIPFLLDSVAGKPALNQEDGIHPNVVGHQKVAGTVWKDLGPLLLRRARRPSTAATM